VTALPLYVAIERIDKSVLDAAYDLYASKREAFLRVILPLTIPGLFAAFLLTFIPALGDYINQQILGGTSNTMIGTVIQNAFLVNLDYAGGSALSAILLAIALVGIFAYAALLGPRPTGQSVCGPGYQPRPVPRRSRRAVRRTLLVGAPPARRSPRRRCGVPAARTRLPPCLLARLRHDQAKRPRGGQ